MHASGHQGLFPVLGVIPYTYASRDSGNHERLDCLWLEAHLLPHDWDSDQLALRCLALRDIPSLSQARCPLVLSGSSKAWLGCKLALNPQVGLVDTRQMDVDDEMNDKVAASSPMQNFLHQSPNGLWSKCRHRARKLAQR